MEQNKSLVICISAHVNLYAIICSKLFFNQIEIDHLEGFMVKATMKAIFMSSIFHSRVIGSVAYRRFAWVIYSTYLLSYIPHFHGFVAVALIDTLHNVRNVEPRRNIHLPFCFNSAIRIRPIICSI